MQLLYFYQYFGTPKGGWSTRVYEMCRRWVEAGHQVTVITSPYDKSDIQATKLIETYHIEGIKVIVINLKQSNKHPVWYRMFTFAAFSLLSIWFALTLPCQAVIASSGPITIGLPGLAARYLRGKPLVFEVRDLWPEGAIQLGILKGNTAQKIAYWFEKRCYKASKLIVACSKGMADSVLQRFPDRNVVVVPNASDNELFSTPAAYQLPDWALAKKLIVYTGSLGVMDNCKQIVDAAAYLQNQLGYDKAQIVFLGEGAEKASLMQHAEALGLNNVHFLGLKPKTEVVAWLQHATAALLVFKNLPVLHTSSPNKMFDAYAAGVPIIQVTRGWIHELIAREHCGMNAETDNPASMAQAIVQICDNPDLRATLAQHAKRVAQEQFDRTLLAQTMLSRIAQIAQP